MHTITSNNYRIKPDVATDVVDTITAWALVADHHAGIIRDGTQTAISVQVWWDDKDPPELYIDYTEAFLLEFAQYVSLITD
jgi:hypothetical protein